MLSLLKKDFVCGLLNIGNIRSIVYDEFKVNKMIKLYANTDVEKKYPFMFGKAKAKLILENIDQIKRFVEQD